MANAENGWTLWVPYQAYGSTKTYGYKLNAEGCSLAQGIFDKLGYGSGDRLYLRMGNTRCALSASTEKADADRTKWSGPILSTEDDIIGLSCDDGGDYETNAYIRPISADPKVAERWTVSIISSSSKCPEEEEVPARLWPELDRIAEGCCGKWKQIETEIDFDGETFTVVFNKECLFKPCGAGFSEKARKTADYVYANLGTVLADFKLRAEVQLG